MTDKSQSADNRPQSADNRPQSADNSPDPEDTGQISVAELLARNGQATAGTSSGGRRRRGVKGGISVAELTGEIPIIRAEPSSPAAPVTVASEAQAPEVKAPVPEASAPKNSRPKNPAPQKEPELLSGSTTAAGDLLNRAHDESARRPYGSKEAQRPSEQRPVPATGKRASPSNETERPARSAGFVPRSRQRADAEPATDVTPKPAVDAKLAPENVRPKTQIQAKSPVPPETQAFDKTDQPKTDQPKTDQPKTDQPKTDQPKTEQLGTAGEASPETEVLKSAPSKAASSKSVASDRDDAPTELVAVVDDDSAAEGAVEDSVSGRRPGKKEAAKQWLALAGQGVVAVIVGALLFKGFERLWDMLPWVALILAVLVIVGLVAVVRILRRTDDMISMVIAIAVGVFVTLGPLAFQLSTG
ncbi:hypothetical protein QMK17_01835 [Rhodococcus sp. G-MC3]|uniref:hypothetical protein n=1 Tax=Rhodococcus sp. G-MC3 TaxID=3046209 RepID=UPI0024BA5968|nr:hypothetical protein [Rhodococcus sp. G-MC3]MDJ0392071.1 hypothetical protein [Rhodococcus sp. G-MC3]